MGNINQWRWKKWVITEEQTENVIKHLKNGIGVEDIAKILSLSTYQVNRVYSEMILNKTKYPSLSLCKLRKTEPYYSNEMDYGTQKLKYNYEECKTEYNLVGKEPTFFGERKDVTIKTFSGVVNPHQSN